MNLTQTKIYKELSKEGPEYAEILERLIRYFSPVALNPKVCKFTDPDWLFFRDNPCFLTSCLGVHDYQKAERVLRACIKHGVLKDDGDGVGRLTAFDWIHKVLKI